MFQFCLCLAIDELSLQLAANTLEESIILWIQQNIISRFNEMFLWRGSDSKIGSTTQGQSSERSPDSSNDIWMSLQDDDDDEVCIVLTVRKILLYKCVLSQ